jgi:hypothetical protein
MASYLSPYGFHPTDCLGSHFLAAQVHPISTLRNDVLDRCSCNPCPFSLKVDLLKDSL